MSLLFIDGFDHYDELLTKWDVRRTGSGNGYSIVQNRGRFTPGALKVGGNSGDEELVKFIDSSTEIIIGHAVQYDTDCLYDVEINGSGGSPAIGRITINAPDIFLHNASGSVVASALGALTAGVWSYIEIRIKSHGTLGEMELKVNGVAAASATGTNTSGAAIEEFVVDLHITGDNCWIDDLYVLNTEGATNNTFLGDVRVTALRPKAAGSSTTFTPTEATGWQSTDETLHDGDTSYVEGGQINAAEDYTNFEFTDIGLAPGTIYGAQVVNATKKTDAGRLDYKDEMVIAGTRYDNGTDVVATSGEYKMTTFIRDTDPSDDATWTESKIAAVGSGFTITFREV